MEPYPGGLFPITISIFSKTDVNLPKHRKVGELPNALDEIGRIKYECYTYPSSTTVNIRDSTIIAIHYKLTPDCFKT